MVKLPPDEDTPEKRVNKIFDLMDNVSKSIILPRKSKKIADILFLLGQGWEVIHGGIQRGFEKGPNNFASTKLIRGHGLNSIAIYRCIYLSVFQF